MRVITELAKGKRLTAPEGKDTTRPTAEKVKEGVFSAIQFLLEEAEVLDLFAGSGQLGIEAISRGAKKAVFVDNDKEAVACIKENLANCGFSGKSYVHQTDVQSYLAGAQETFDMVFLDPPFRRGLLEQVVQQLEQRALLSPQALIYLEHEREHQPALPPNWLPLRATHAGQVTAQLLRRQPVAQSD